MAGETDFGARRVYEMRLPAGAANGAFGRTIGGLLPPLGVLLVPEPAQHGGSDIQEIGADGAPVVSLSQNGLDYFDIHHTADDTLDKIDPKQLKQAVAIWSAFTYLAAMSDIDFRGLAATVK